MLLCPTFWQVEHKTLNGNHSPVDSSRTVGTGFGVAGLESSAPHAAAQIARKKKSPTRKPMVGNGALVSIYLILPALTLGLEIQPLHGQFGTVQRRARSFAEFSLLKCS